MGYAGYTAAKLPPPKASALQAALWSVDNMECLEVCTSNPMSFGDVIRYDVCIVSCVIMRLSYSHLSRLDVSVQVMSKLVRNTAVSPSEDKFKRIKLTNSKVKTTIVDTTGGVPSLLAMGWVYDEADKEFLMLPKGVQMTMKEVGRCCCKPTGCTYHKSLSAAGTCGNVQY